MEQPQTRPIYKVLTTRAIVSFAVGVAVFGLSVAIWLIWAFGSGTESDKASLDAIKTAGTIVVGTGGAAALWLAARRQQATEVALRQKDLEQAHQERVANHHEQDAAAKRVTDLYTKAVEQLGSEKAPVRLGGMYALERLAQTETGQRRTVLKVLCAYLRMPFSGIDNIKGHADNVEAEEQDKVNQERQVRLTAQRIVSIHVQPGEEFWGDPGSPVDLDLTGATLIDFSLEGCHVGAVTFMGAKFIGETNLGSAVFGGQAEFNNAQFLGDTWFTAATFADRAVFYSAKFSKKAIFNKAQFEGDAGFHGVVFNTDARFMSAEFRGQDNEFQTAKFEGDAWFRDSNFAGDVWFNAIAFGANVWLENVSFAGLVTFNKSTVAGKVNTAGAKVRLDVDDREKSVWPEGLSVSPALPIEASPLPNKEGRWGLLGNQSLSRNL